MAADSPEQLHSLLAAAFNAGDPDAAIELYELDAKLVVPPDGRLASGALQIRDSFVETLALRPTARFQVVGKVQSEGLALTHGRWLLDGTDAAGDPVTLSGRGTMVSRRQDDGGWRIALDNAMTPD
jgi:ketosteroid isomerase-like protein